MNIEALRVNYKKPHSLPLIMFGAFLLGCGMAVCGACPGTVVAQMGTGAHQQEKGKRGKEREAEGDGGRGCW
jgi:hypothetical protein